MAGLRILLWTDTGSLHLLSIARNTNAVHFFAMKPDFLTSLVHCYVPSTQHWEEIFATSEEAEE